jgi:hypothetical protein
MMFLSKIKAAAIIVFGAVAATGVGTGAVALVQAQAARSSATTQPAVATLSYTARLKNGISVELIGVSEHPSAGKPWWRADGSPLSKAPYRRMNGSVSSDDVGVVRREFAMRINAIPDGKTDPATVNWDFASSHGTAHGGAIAGVEGIAAILDDTHDGVTLRCDVATGPWETVAKIPVTPGGSAGTGLAKYTIETIQQKGANAIVNYSRSGITTGHVDWKWVGIDAAGREHDPRSTSMTGSLFGATGSLEFQAPSDSLKTLEIRQRPYDQWMEIRNVSLYAGELKPVEVVTSDDQPPATNPAP